VDTSVGHAGRDVGVAVTPTADSMTIHARSDDVLWRASEPTDSDTRVLSGRPAVALPAPAAILAGPRVAWRLT
jgi:hypothetical protein